MVSVGILSAQIGGRAIWTVPGTFVTVMALGGVLGWLDVGLTSIEFGIAFSVLVLGIAIAADRKMPILVAMGAVAIFAIFHGYAHGAEMPTVANPVRYALGFMTGTALLHIAGVLVGDISQHYARGKVLLRIAGAAIAGVPAPGSSSASRDREKRHVRQPADRPAGSSSRCGKSARSSGCASRALPCTSPSSSASTGGRWPCSRRSMKARGNTRRCTSGRACSPRWSSTPTPGTSPTTTGSARPRPWP